MAMEPIYVNELLPVLDRRLIELLRSLGANDWTRLATPKWTVKEVASHLLDGNLRRLSMARDGYWGEPFTGSSERELVDFLHGLNADWVKATRRLSPDVLIALLETTNARVTEYFQSLDPRGRAVFAVSWAGEKESENWFDIAREYTEKWHHQQQIREAVGKGLDAIATRELYYPVLDTFIRVLPHRYEQVEATDGSAIGIHVQGDAGGSWYLHRQESAWTLARTRVGENRGEVVIPQAIAWRLFTKGLSKGAAKAQVQCTGDPALTSPMLDVLAIVG
jgi:uncharacterized protein (TIGR03083 family)